MDARHDITHGTWRLLIAAIVALAFVMTLGTGQVAAGSKGCSVKDKATSRTYSTLQAAVNAAKPRAALLVRGTCVGRTVISKRLTINGVETRRSGEPRLSGADRVRVLVVKRRAQVKLSDLVVVRGRARRGAGILNHGTLTLANVRVRGNRAPRPGIGAGIYNSGTLAVNRGSRIVGNHGFLAGGVYNGDSGGAPHRSTVVVNGASVIAANRGACASGVYNWGTFTMNDTSTIAGNRMRDPATFPDDPCPSGSGWGAVANRGVFRMNDDSSIRGNDAGVAPTPGGVTNDGYFTMSQRSSISGNTGNMTGGLLIDMGSSGRLIMKDDSAITGNSARWNAGGVFAWGGEVVAMRDRSMISGNTGETGGIEIFSNVSLRMSGASSITGNTGTDGPGGIWVGDYVELAGVSCGPGGNVYGNTPDDCYLAE